MSASDSLGMVALLTAAIAIVPLWSIAASLERVADVLDRLRDMAERGRR